MVSVDLGQLGSRTAIRTIARNEITVVPLLRLINAHFNSSDAGKRLTRVRSEIELVQLRYIVTAADRGSLRQAAEFFRVQHSVLSRSIRELEQSIGTVVFERSGSGVKPTTAGQSVLKMARMILEQVDVLAAIAISNERGSAGRLTVGFCTSISAGNLRATFVDFRARFSGVEFTTVERSRVRLSAQLRNGVVDVLILAGDVASLGERTLPLWSERILVAVPEEHPFAARDAVFWTDLRTEIVLLSSYDPGREFEGLLMSKLAYPRDRPKIERHDVSRGILKSLISMKLGIGLVMESDIGADFAGLKYRELRDGSGPSRIEFSAIWLSDNKNPALTNFLKLLAERYPIP